MTISVIEAMKAAAKARRDDMKSLEVVIAGHEVTVFFYTLTTGEITQLQRRHPQFMSKEGTPFEALVDMVVLKAMTEDGERMFKPTDKHLLKLQSVETMSNIAAPMFGDEVTAETYEGN